MLRAPKHRQKLDRPREEHPDGRQIVDWAYSRIDSCDAEVLPCHITHDKTTTTAAAAGRTHGQSQAISQLSKNLLCN